MTRINLIPPEELCNQHLLAEWRELPRMAQFSKTTKNPIIPKTYVLGAGHMKFFLNKPSFLEDRHIRLTEELVKRGFRLSLMERFVMPKIFGDFRYIPSTDDIILNRLRIAERLPKNATWELKSLINQ